MVNSCCVPESKSGYKFNKKSQPVALFKFPQNDIMQQKWIKAIPRKNWTVTQYHRVCAHHFTEDDFITKSNDLKKTRKLARTHQHMERIRSKPTAVPHIFLSLPQYLSSIAPAPRPTTSSTSAARLMNESIQINKQANLLFENEKVKNLSELKEKIKTESLPGGFVFAEEGGSICYHYIKHSANPHMESPKLLDTVFHHLSHLTIPTL